MATREPTCLYLRGSDSSDPFTRASIQDRLPSIIHSVIERNKHLADSSLVEITSLESGIRENKVLPALKHRQNIPFSAQLTGTQHDLDGKGNEIASQNTWQGGRWWAVENAAYRFVMEAVDFAIDPFVPHKRDALFQASPSFLATALVLSPRGGVAATPVMWCSAVSSALLRSLWGNRADLSLSGGTVDTSHFDAPGKEEPNPADSETGHEQLPAKRSSKDTLISDNTHRKRQRTQSEQYSLPATATKAQVLPPLTAAGGMLRDDVPGIVKFLSYGAGNSDDQSQAASASRTSSTSTSVQCTRVTIVLDNCGLELLCDLVLADALLCPVQGDVTGSASTSASTAGGDTGDSSMHQLVDRVELVAKTDPVFVSDATVLDVEEHMLFLEAVAAGPQADEDHASGSGARGGKGWAEAEAKATAAVDGTDAKATEGQGQGQAEGVTTIGPTPGSSESGRARMAADHLAWNAVGLAGTVAATPGQRERIHDLMARLRGHLKTGRLTVRDETFFNSPLPMEEAPADVFQRLAQTATSASGFSVAESDGPGPGPGPTNRPRTLVLFKGDANYRRLLGDRHWPHDTPLTTAWGYWGDRMALTGADVAVAALRTAKSGVLAGVLPGRSTEAAALRPGTWLVEGRFAVAEMLELA